MKILKSHIQTNFHVEKNEHFLCYNNYIISVVFNPLRLNFYNTNNFDKDFQLTMEKTSNFYQYKIWKLFQANDSQLFLIGQEPFEPGDYNLYDDKECKRLGIYHLKMNERIIKEKAKFTYYNYYEDLKNNKLHIYTGETIIVYDFLKNTSKETNLNIPSKGSSTNIEDFILVDDYLLLFTMIEISKNIYVFDCDIMDKKLEYQTNGLIFPNSFYLDLDQIFDYINKFKYFILISDNYFYIEDNNEHINIVEIKIKNNEKLLKDDNIDISFDEDSDIFKLHKINIKKEGEIKFYLLNNKKFAFNINIKEIYICQLSNMEIIIKLELNLKENLSLMAIQEKNDKYKIFFGNLEKMLCISN